MFRWYWALSALVEAGALVVFEAGPLVVFEVLNFTFVLLSGLSALERSEVPPLAGVGIFLARIDAVLA